MTVWEARLDSKTRPRDQRASAATDRATGREAGGFGGYRCKESELRLISGKGMGGFSDGGSAYAMFNHPRSFAVDSNDNVYVADRMNHAIRKISSSGMTTTIAGNNSSKPGHADGPGQNATFSEDFDLVYMPKMCALLISDRGNRIIRQMNLKPEDCIEKTQSSKGLGVIHVSIVAVLCLLCGLAMGFFARPYMMPPPRSSEASSSRFSLHYWNHLRPTARIPIPTLASGVRNVVVSFKFLFLLLLRLVSLGARHLNAVFGNTRSLVDEAPEGKEAALLLDPDSSKKLQVAVANHENSMKDLLDLSVANVHVEVDDAWEGEQQKEGNLDMKIANMMKVNLVEFTGKSSRQGVIRRKPI
ncbi:hypothetical protein HPP92_019451 [Vanilla planifolia]|uniref:NHL domain-containing protein n=1 Tax=Vanilla planifolia TaxID=51239 RepID=A0A835Q9M2_VANPL|nr:hypothetical protein HPP92_019451 [Vanilla planifolia]